MEQSKADYEEVLAQRLAALLVAAWRGEQANRQERAQTSTLAGVNVAASDGGNDGDGRQQVTTEP